MENNCYSTDQLMYCKTKKNSCKLCPCSGCSALPLLKIVKHHFMPVLFQKIPQVLVFLQSQKSIESEVKLPFKSYLGELSRKNEKSVFEKTLSFFFSTVNTISELKATLM